MSPYTVDWIPEALSELANLWTQASDRQAVTDAQERIDELLARDPFGNGQHRSEGLYRIDVAPLTCTYSIDTTRRFVEVNWVWRTS